ncbi:unnamed protein product, partial [Mesorhabditis belari]|uniref:Uncharacterized protein n=1 Tax=Mesorhabditis belari TaxID=2138241 RepID=A0AAF3FBK7_9BILA
MGQFADFLVKLRNIGGYQQSIPLICNASLPAKEDDPWEDDFERDESEMAPSMHVDLPMLPQLSLFDDYTYRNVTPQFFELMVAGDTFRFAHPPAHRLEIRAKRYQLPRIPDDKVTNLIIPGVMLQGNHRRHQWPDLFEVDLYMEFANGGPSGAGPLIAELRAQGYVVI